MKILTNSNTRTISGGQTESLTVTTKISLNGISDQCVNTLSNIAPLIIDTTRTDEQSAALFVSVLQNCTLTELDLIDQRSDAAPFLTVKYK